jgi:hypothetical protein
VRQYQPLWIKIKTTGKASVAAAPLFHKRIIKAVVKEKDMDTGFKILCDEKKTPCRLVSSRSGGKLMFELDYAFNRDDL